MTRRASAVPTVDLLTRTDHVESHGEITVASQDAGFADLAPLLDELNAKFTVVSARVVNYQGMAAGGGEIFLELIAVGGGTYLLKFVEAIAADHAKALRNKIVDLMRKGKPRQSRDGFVPLRLQVAGISFYFDKPVTAEELEVRLSAARLHIASLPIQALITQSYGLYWDPMRYEWVRARRGSEGDIRPHDAG